MSPTRRGLRPGKPVTGALPVPPSKSLAQRALVLSSLCSEPVWLGGLTGRSAPGDDILRTRAALESLGVAVDSPLGSALRIRGLPPGPGRGWRAANPVDVGESGTLARLAAAVAGLCGRPGAPIEFQARGSLSRRSSPALFASLCRAGVRVEHLGIDAGWPLRLWPVGPPSCLEIVAPSSSQEVSALLCAAAAWPDALEVHVRGEIPSLPYVAMTTAMLERFSVRVESLGPREAPRFVVRGPLRPPAGVIPVEPDASAAAVLLAGACLSGGEGNVAGLGLDSLQGDVRVVEHLRAFGCAAGLDERGAFAGGAPSRGAELDLGGEPDLAPVLAALAAAAAQRAGATSRLSGLGTLQGKESARIDVLARGLAALGFSVRAGAASLEIAPGSAPPRGAVLDPRADHRMAFAFALLGLVVDDVDVLDPDCVSKSWPGFWADCELAGARVTSQG
ncbi:MAG: hypothetical protein IPK67_08465 [Planctomycetes bacterium]|nr:hypothetical protein [Planctomycetota bacterium]